jgi:SAM-dependent methyltransferase
MIFIPWRVKNFVSEHFPLLYHLLRNAGTKGNSAEHWDQQLARTWNDANRYWPSKNELIATLTKPSHSVLDVGCGNGGILRDLKGRGFSNLHGLERSAYSIKRLTDEGIQMHFGELPAIPLPDDSFDVVIASQVLEHIIRRNRFMREIRRVLKPGGRAFIFVPDDCLGPISEPEHVIKFNDRTLHKLLTKYFSVIKLESMRDVNFPMQVLFAHVEKRHE